VVAVQCMLCICIVPLASLLKAKMHYVSFPVASPQEVGDFPVAISQQVRNINEKSGNKLAQTKVRCVVSFPKFHYNDLLTTSWQLPCLQESCRETCAVEFGHLAVNCPFGNLCSADMWYIGLHWRAILIEPCDQSLLSKMHLVFGLQLIMRQTSGLYQTPNSNPSPLTW